MAESGPEQSLFNIFGSSFYPIMIKMCNGFSSVPFSKAYLSVECAKKMGIPTSYFFSDGLQCLAKDVDDSGNEKKSALDCIKNYISDKEKHQECLTALKTLESEVEVQAVLTTHLFGPLVPDSCEANKFVIDEQQQPTIDKCPKCGEKVPQKLRHGDTSVGSPEVWHGSPDIILRKCAVVVNTDTAEGDIEEDVLLSNGPVEVETTMNFVKDAEQQAMAQTIANAFYEAKCQSRLKDAFIPTFFVTNERVKIYLYCCEKDLLLESGYLDIFDGKSLDISTLVILWLAINFDCFAIVDVLSRSAEALGLKIPKSNFQPLAEKGGVLDVYRNGLSRPVKMEEANELQDLFSERGRMMNLRFWNDQHLKDQIDTISSLAKVLHLK